MNKAIIIGRLGKDAETKFTQGGIAVTKFSVATDEKWKDKASGEFKTETTWHNVVLWRKEALANYLTKGTKVMVEGKIANRNYEDKDGKKVYTSEIVGDNVELLGDKKEGSGDSGRSAPAARAAAAPRSSAPARAAAPVADTEPEYTDEDVPF